MKTVTRTIIASTTPLLATLALAQTAEFLPLGSPPGGSNLSQGWAVTDDGDTLSGWGDGDFNGSPTALGFQASQSQGLTLLPQIQGRDVNGASGDGTLVFGQVFMEDPRDPGNFGLTGWYWTPATGTTVELWSPTLDTFSGIRAASTDGSTLVGFMDFFLDINSGISFSRAFVWTQATGMVPLPDIPNTIGQAEATAISGDGSTIAGFATDFNVKRQSVVWANDTLTILPHLPAGLQSSVASAMSDNGQFVAGFELMTFTAAGFREDAYLWSDATGIQSLGTTPVGFVSAIPSWVANDGSMVVGTLNRGFFFDQPEGEGFVWTPNDGIRLLKDILQQDHGVDMTGWELLAAHDASLDGTTIVGYALTPDRSAVTAYFVNLDITRCAADLTTSSNPNDPGFAIPDGILDANDFFFYLGLFAAGDLAADLTGSINPNDPSFGVPDGTLDANDFFFYIDLFAKGCP